MSPARLYIGMALCLYVIAILVSVPVPHGSVFFFIGGCCFLYQSVKTANEDDE